MNPFQQAGFAGPYKLAQYEQTVRRGEIGLYVFLDLFGEPKHIARSDSDLASRVRGWTQTCDSFWVEYHSATRAAYMRECELYHRYRDKLDNKAHPALPAGADWRCPTKGCELS
jgi:hypothetical protein